MYNLSKYPLFRSCPVRFLQFQIMKSNCMQNQAWRTCQPRPLTVGIPHWRCCCQHWTPWCGVAALRTGCWCSSQDRSVTMPASLGHQLFIQNPGQVHLIGQVKVVDQVPGPKKTGKPSFWFLCLDAGTAIQHNLYLEKISKYRCFIGQKQISKNGVKCPLSWLANCS